MYKKICILFLTIVMCCCGCVKKREISSSPISNHNHQESAVLIKQIFDIYDSEYKIAEEKNSLSDSEYGGTYSVILELTSENMATFISEVEKSFYIPEETEGYNIIIKNIYGKELGENDVFYTRMSSVKRVVNGADSVPKTCESYIICEATADNVHRVKMIYLE